MLSMNQVKEKTEDKQIIKERTQDSQLRKKIQRGCKIFSQKKISERCGNYYMFNDMPLHPMALIIISFKSNSFDKIFERHSNSISDVGFKRKKTCKENTKYWMFDYQLNKKVNWELIKT